MNSNHSSQSTLTNNEKSIQNDCVNTYLRIRPCDVRSKNYGVIKDTLWVQKNGRTNDKKSVFYSFNSIFEENSSQEELFTSTTMPLVKEFLCGRNNLVFSYGITSSGKSYTMRGTVNSPGLIPYSLLSVFETISPFCSSDIPTCKISKFCDVRRLNDQERAREKALRENSVSMRLYNASEEILSQISCQNLFEDDEDAFTDEDECSIWVSFFEIYNEKFFDLLRPGTEMQVVTSEKNYYLKEATQVHVTSAVNAFAVFLKGQENLHMDATNLNNHSSRSHSVFTLSLLKTNRITKQTSISKLCFADLAGNERVKKIGLGKIMETTNINKSLMTLSRCIQELMKKSTMIPVRDSNLTKVFQPYLTNSGGKMNLIYNLNPSEYLFEESSNSLDFCKASQKITQTLIEEFRRTIDTKENIPRKVEDCLQKIRKSVSFLNCHDSQQSDEKINELKKQLEEFEQQIHIMEQEKLRIYKTGDELLTHAKKTHKSELQKHEERFRMMEEVYREKFDELEVENQKQAQEIFDLNERNSLLEINYLNAEKDKQVLMEKNLILEEEIERLKSQENKLEYSQDKTDEPIKESKDETIDLLTLSTETPTSHQKSSLSSIVIDTPGEELASSFDRYRTPIKPKRKGQNICNDSTVELYLASAKKARKIMTNMTPERKSNSELKKIELTKTAKKRMAIASSISDECDQTISARRYNFRSKTKLNIQ